MTAVRLILAILAASVCGAVNAQAPRSGLPSDLWVPAEANGCDDLTDYFESVNTRDPPFVFGVVDGSYSGIFWCRWRDGDLNKLVFWRVPGGARLQRRPLCPSTIVQRNIIGGGLRLERQSVNLSNLSYLDENQDEPFDPEWAPGPDLEVETTAILTSRGGVGTLFVCYRGRWLYTNLD